MSSAGGFILNNETVLALSPDASSTKAAQSLLSPSKWPTLGADDDSVWGECQGSGSKPYQTQVDLSGSAPAFRCSCPSRKFPCKHGLALLLLRVKNGGAFSRSEPPPWVAEWLSARQEREQKKEEKKREKTAAPVDAEAAAEREDKRRATRWSRIELAASELKSWLCDQISRGLGSLSHEQVAGWHTVAARLVDAQAPGLAYRVREAAAGIRQGEDWPQLLLHRLGLLQLLCEAIARRQELAPELQDELRIQAGWPFEKADVIESGERVTDSWTVLGQIVEEGEDRLSERRVWLHGRKSGRRALLLDHAYGGRGFEMAWQTGSSFDAALAFFPGSGVLRAVVAGNVAPSTPDWPSWALEDEWGALAARVAANPWVRLHPVVFSDAVPLPSSVDLTLASGGRTVRLRVTDEDAWSLLACSGGNPLSVMGEWDGFALRPLCAREGAWLWQRGCP